MSKICSICNCVVTEDNSSCPACGNFEAVLSSELSRHLLITNNQETLMKLKRELADYLDKHLDKIQNPPKVEMRYKVPRKLKKKYKKTGVLWMNVWVKPLRKMSTVNVTVNIQNGGNSFGC
jgi:RNA polymerase subunit RPABC4/transcription elongation factor Spt4